MVEKVEEEEEAIPFREAITKLFHNKYWVIVLIVNLLACILYGTTAAAGTYYCKWIFGNDNLVGLLGGVGLIPTFLGFALVGVMIKKLGVVGTLKFSFGIGIISNVLMILLHNNFTAYMVLGCFTTFATIPMMCLVGVMTTMAIYGFSFIVPLIAFVVMYVLVSRFDLEKKLPQMREEVAKRKQEAVK